ncbi:MAG: hypothetical protein AAGF12_39570 [Myxococcota bacterium]
MVRLYILVLPLLGVLGGCLTSSDAPSSWYEDCGRLSDCRAGTDECFDIRWESGRGGMCSGFCVDDLDCPGNGSCFELVGDPSEARICFENCVNDRDCAGGFLCIPAQRQGAPAGAICLPR